MSNKINLLEQSKNGYKVLNYTYFNNDQDIELLPIFIRLNQVINYVIETNNVVNKTSLFNFKTNLSYTPSTKIKVIFELSNYYPNFKLTNNLLASQLFQSSNFSTKKYVEEISKNLDLKRTFRKSFKNALLALQKEYDDEQTRINIWSLEQFISNVDYTNSKQLSASAKKVLETLINATSGEVLKWYEETLIKLQALITSQELLLQRNEKLATFDANFENYKFEGKVTTPPTINYLQPDEQIQTRTINYMQSFARTYFKVNLNSSDDLINNLYVNYLAWLFKLKATSILRVKEKLIYSPSVKSSLNNLIVIENVVLNENKERYYELVPNIFTSITESEHEKYLNAFIKTTINFLNELLISEDYLSFKNYTQLSNVNLQVFKEYLTLVKTLKVANIPTCTLQKQIFLKGAK